MGTLHSPSTPTSTSSPECKLKRHGCSRACSSQKLPPATAG